MLPKISFGTRMDKPAIKNHRNSACKRDPRKSLIRPPAQSKIRPEHSQSASWKPSRMEAAQPPWTTCSIVWLCANLSVSFELLYYPLSIQYEILRGTCLHLVDNLPVVTRKWKIKSMVTYTNNYMLMFNIKINPNQRVWSLKDHQVLEIIIWIKVSQMHCAITCHQEQSTKCTFTCLFVCN